MPRGTPRTVIGVETSSPPVPTFVPAREIAFTTHGHGTGGLRTVMTTTKWPVSDVAAEVVAARLHSAELPKPALPHTWTW